MNGHFAVKTAVILIFLVLLSTCGDMNTLLPSSGTYQVRTLVNGNSLEGCSIVRAGDKIRPYFAMSVVNDPDLVGLLVSVQNSQGDIIGERIRYTLQSYAYETDQAGTGQTETETITTEVTNELEETMPNETDETLSEEKTAVKDELTGHSIVEEQSSSLDAADTANVVPQNDVVVIVSSLSRELPYIPLSKTLEIGSYKLVFEALGKRETLSHTETNIFYLGNAEFNLKDIVMYLPELSGAQLIPPGTMVMLETRLDFDSFFDPYLIWYNGKNIISEGKMSEGAGKLLWEAPEQAGFYSLRLEAFPRKLNRGFTGISREINLPVSPKVTGTGYFFENDSKYTVRNSLASGTAYAGQLRLIQAMAESAEEAEEPPVPPTPPELLQWYQFRGSLYDSASTQDSAKTLSAVREQEPQWAAAGQSYGLSIGTEEAYSLSPVKFFRVEKNQGGGLFLFHIRPIGEGTIFSAFFPLEAIAEDGIWMNIVMSGKIMTLRLNSGTAAVEIPIYLNSVVPQSLIPVAVEFYIRPYRIEAKFSLDTGQVQESTAVSIPLPGALTGEAAIRLGNIQGTAGDTTEKSLSKPRTSSAEVQEETVTLTSTSQLTPAVSVTDLTAVSAVQTTLSTITETEETGTVETQPQETLAASTIWDELAVLFSAIPLLEEELPQTEERNPVEQMLLNQTSTVTDIVPSLKETTPTIDNKTESSSTETAAPGDEEKVTYENIPSTDTVDTDDEQEILINISGNS